MARRRRSSGPSARDLAELGSGKASARDRAEAAAGRKRKKHNSTKKRRMRRPKAR